MKKNLLPILLVLAATKSFAQFNANIESNSQYYIDDNKIKLTETDAKYRFRSNNYLNLSYKINHFTVGAQIESYEPKALLNYSPVYDKTGVGTYFVNYNNEDKGLDITFGHFYEQFGSGLALRLWEDKQLGIANSLIGGKIKYSDPSQIVTIKAFAGKQRLGFKLTDGFISGGDVELNLKSMFNSEKLGTNIGFSLVNKIEDNAESPASPKNVQVYSSRIKMDYSNLSMNLEYLYKTPDNIKNVSSIDPLNIFPGNAWNLNLSYVANSFGINANLRRLENFNFYSQRNQIGNVYNNAVLNYVPALTKQFDYSLANIYVYQAQPQLTFLPQKKSGEIGSQFDIFYKIKKETLLGGKFGTEVTANISNWYGLKGTYRNYINNVQDYKTEFLSLGEKYYSDQSLDIKTKLKENWISSLTFINQYYNTYRAEETSGEVHAQTLVLNNSYRFAKTSARLELQHQWADASYKNWLAALLEFNFKKNWSVFANDLYNYGNPDEAKQMHYYQGGLVFRKNSTRIQAAYGRQRGGLLCVGGVCRYVPESAGFSLGLTTSL